MKMMKLALLGGAALAVTSAGAMADDLSSLKSSMEDMGVIAAPVADAPEGATITWSGYVRQALTYSHTDSPYVHVFSTVDGATSTVTDKKSGFDLDGGRARLTVNATTPTSVGDVDVHVQFGATQAQPRGGWGVSLVDYWGTWHITPELSFQGGRMFTGGTSQGTTYGHSVGLSDSFATTTDNALQLGYASGPVSFVIGIENGDDDVGGTWHMDSTPDFYANMGWKGDMFTVALQGNYVVNEGATDSYQVGGNVAFNMSDAIALHVAGVVGHGEPGFFSDGRGDYWGIAGGATAHLSESTKIEATGGYVNADLYDKWNVNAGVYWTPASALTIGLQGDYTSTDWAAAGLATTDSVSASLVTWWRF